MTTTTPSSDGSVSGGGERSPRSLARWWQHFLAVLVDQSGSQITDNLGLIVIGIVAIVAIGGLISGLDSTIFSWISKQLGMSS